MTTCILRQLTRTKNTDSVDLKIEGGHELHGEITINTSKNSAVALLCASLLNHGTTRTHRSVRIRQYRHRERPASSRAKSLRDDYPPGERELHGARFVLLPAETQR